MPAGVAIEIVLKETIKLILKINTRAKRPAFAPQSAWNLIPIGGMRSPLDYNGWNIQGPSEPEYEKKNNFLVAIRIHMCGCDL